MWDGRTVSMWNTILETKSVIGFDPWIHLGEDTPISNKSFCYKFEKAFLSWDLLCCDTDLSWPCTVNQMEGENTQKNPPLEIFIILNRKDSLSPWDCIISLRLNPLDTVHSPPSYAWITTCKTTSDLQIAVTVDWIKPLTQSIVRDI